MSAGGGPKMTNREQRIQVTMLNLSLIVMRLLDRLLILNMNAHSTTRTYSLVLLAACLVLPMDSQAGEWRIEKVPKVTAHARIWQSQGHTEIAHSSAELVPVFGDPTSVLDYRDVDSTVLELGARVDLRGDWFLETSIGAGIIDGGSLVDDDFVSAAGSDFFNASVPGAHMISRTESEISDDDLFYVNLLFGRNIFRSTNKKARIGLFGQVQHWEETYVAQGLRQTVCTAPGNFCEPAGFIGFQGANVISNKVRWQTVSVGAEGQFNFSKRIELSGRLTASPLARLKNDDVHLLREDLAQNPSFREEGTGYGYGLELNAAYFFTPQLAAQVGYRYWKMKVENESNGQLTFPVEGGPPVASELNSFTTSRHGLLLSLSYMFGYGPQSAIQSQGP